MGYKCCKMIVSTFGDITFLGSRMNTDFCQSSGHCCVFQILLSRQRKYFTPLCPVFLISSVGIYSSPGVSLSLYVA